MKKLLIIFCGLVFAFAGDAQFSRSVAFRGAAARKSSSSGGGGVMLGTVFVTNGHGTALRHNFSGKIGFRFTPSVDMTVVALGRVVISGNSGTHAMVLDNPVCATLASCTIDTTSTPTSVNGVNYVFAAVTPVSLTHGVAYSILTTEVNNGDFWYDADATLTTTSDAAIGAAIFGTCPYNSGAGAGTSYGPVNFQYTIP